MENDQREDGRWVHKQRWRPEITVNGVRRKLGSFKTPEEAHEAYMKAAREAWGEFARG